MISFMCPHCKKEISFNFLKPGDETKCPLCQSPVKVPDDAKTSPGKVPMPQLPGENIKEDKKPGDSEETVFSQKDHKMLKSVSKLLEILGWVAGVVTLLFSFLFLSLTAATPQAPGEAFIIIFIMYAFFAVITVALFIFLSRSIRLSLNLNQNVANIFDLLKKAQTAEKDEP